MIRLTPDNYAQHRDHIQSGDLLAWRGTSTLGKLIRRWTASDYSHVGIAWVFGGRVFVLEAREFRGVVITPLSSALHCDLLKTGSLWTDEIEGLALSEIGNAYSYGDVLRVAVGLPPLSNHGWQCAEYAAWLLHFSGVKLPAFRQTPGELVEAVLQLNHT